MGFGEGSGFDGVFGFVTGGSFQDVVDRGRKTAPRQGSFLENAAAFERDGIDAALSSALFPMPLAADESLIFERVEGRIESSFFKGKRLLAMALDLPRDGVAVEEAAGLRKPLRISRTIARRILLRGQGFDAGWLLPSGKDGALDIIERLGYVQIDTISVVRRAHEHILWTRHPEFRPEMLHALQAKDRRVFEYWTHAASYLPMSHYRFYLPRRWYSYK